MGNYCFCYHSDFQNLQKIEFLKTTKGLDYFLNGFKNHKLKLKTSLKDVKNQKIMMDI